jgi:hypothetical protein
MMFAVLVAFAEMAAVEVHAAGLGARGTVQAAPQERSADSTGEIEQLTNRRTGVTCTMRILKAEPVDRGAVVPSPEQNVDPGIRGSVSPCVE